MINYESLTINAACNIKTKKWLVLFSMKKMSCPGIHKVENYEVFGMSGT